MNEPSRSVKAYGPRDAVVEMRRMPVQARGRRTVARILDAAAKRFVEVGYDATTTTEIAKRAGVSVGSLYQFFPDKEALLEALAVRHIERIDEILASAQLLGEQASLADIVALIVERIVAYAREQPFFGVLLAGAGSPPVARASAGLRSELARRVELIIAFKPITARRRSVVASVCVDLLGALLPRTLDDRGRTRPAMIRELELALGAYLAAVTPSETGHASARLHWAAIVPIVSSDPNSPPLTIYEWGGGRPAFEHWLDTFYDLVESDDLLAPLFGGRVSAEHRRNVTTWWCEVMGGPARYSEDHGGYPHMISKHFGLGITAEQRLRFVTLLSSAADDAGLPADPEFRAAIMGYAEWGTRLAQHNSQPGADVVQHAPVPRWGWGEAPPYRP